MPPSPSVPSTRKRFPTSCPSSTARSASAWVKASPSSRGAELRSSRAYAHDPREEEGRDDEERHARGPRVREHGRERPPRDRRGGGEGHRRRREREEEQRRGVGLE